MKKSIDFDRVADLYDAYVATDVDLGFWLDVIQRSDSPRIELMCGTGRITMAALRVRPAEEPVLPSPLREDVGFADCAKS